MAAPIVEGLPTIRPERADFLASPAKVKKENVSARCVRERSFILQAPF